MKRMKQLKKEVLNMRNEIDDTFALTTIIDLENKYFNFIRQRDVL